MKPPMTAKERREFLCDQIIKTAEKLELLIGTLAFECSERPTVRDLLTKAYGPESGKVREMEAAFSQAIKAQLLLKKGSAQ